MGVFRIRAILRAHHRSLVDDSSSSWRLMVAVYGPAALTLAGGVTVVACFPGAIAAKSGALASLGAAFGLFASVMFGLSMTLLDKAIDLDVQGLRPGDHGERVTSRLVGLSANTLFTSVVSGGVVVLLVVVELVPVVAALASALALSAMMLVATNALLIAGRVFADTVFRMERIVSGSSFREFELNKEASGPDLGGARGSSRDDKRDEAS